VSQHREVIYGPYQYAVIGANAGPPTEFAITQAAARGPAVAAAPEAAPAPQELAASREVKVIRFEREPVAEPAPAADPPPAGKLARAADYSWLSGEVQRWRRELRLRYAPVDEVDAHGGCLTLTGDGLLDDLREGDHVRVRGRLVQAEGRTSPVYQVESVTPLER
jgi:hypothetical protein